LPRILFLNTWDGIEALQVQRIPPALLDKVLLHGRYQPFTRSTKNLAPDPDRVLEHLARSGAPALLDLGASIIPMTCPGILIGSRRIVFVNVDLNNTDYFWE